MRKHVLTKVDAVNSFAEVLGGDSNVKFYFKPEWLFIYSRDSEMIDGLRSKLDRGLISEETFNYIIDQDILYRLNVISERLYPNVCSWINEELCMRLEEAKTINENLTLFVFKAKLQI